MRSFEATPHLSHEPHTPSRRRSPRRLCSALVRVSFSDQRGAPIEVVALVEDLNDSGICLSCSLPLSPGRTVRLEADGLDRRGAVRYCELGDYSYLVGIDLGPDWRGDWRPTHELLVLDDATGAESENGAAREISDIAGLLEESVPETGQSPFNGKARLPALAALKDRPPDESEGD